MNQSVFGNHQGLPSIRLGTATPQINQKLLGVIAAHLEADGRAKGTSYQPKKLDALADGTLRGMLTEDVPVLQACRAAAMEVGNTTVGRTVADLERVTGLSLPAIRHVAKDTGAQRISAQEVAKRVAWVATGNLPEPALSYHHLGQGADLDARMHPV